MSTSLSKFPNIGGLGCTCPSTADIGRATFAGQTIESTCELHHADELASRRAEKAAATAATEADHLRARAAALYDAIRTDPEVDPEPDTPTDPLLDALIGKVGNRTDNVLPLNATANQFAHLLGIASTNDDGPAAA
jgi:hypothetical protein